MIHLFHYNESPIQFEEIGGQIMANATSMCEAFGKRPVDWLRLENTKRYMEAISKKLKKETLNTDSQGVEPNVRIPHITENQLVTTRQGNRENGSGTWIHERLVLSLARWLSIDFELWCDDKITELIRTGKATIDPMDEFDFMEMQLKRLKENSRKLREHDGRIGELESRVITDPHYYKVMAYANIRKIKLDKPESARLGKLASKICRERGLTVEKVKDTNYGIVNAYPVEVLEEIFG